MMTNTWAPMPAAATERKNPRVEELSLVLWFVGVGLT